MARANSRNAKTLSMAHPVLTGDSYTDTELWRLSFVLADIAEQTIINTSNIEIRIEKKIRQTVNHVNVLPSTEEVTDA